MYVMINTFVVVLAAIFPVVNPPGSALVFFSLTSKFSKEARRVLAKRVALNSLFVLLFSFLMGAVVLKFYGISVPVLRLAGGFIVAVSGWKLLNEGSQKEIDASRSSEPLANPLDLAFYPLTLPLTTGPGTIAVVISIGTSGSMFTDHSEGLPFIIASTVAIFTISVAILICFLYADKTQAFLGRGGTDIAVRLSAFILFTLGVQIIWSGFSELMSSIIPASSVTGVPNPLRE
jgi:multiple antibiotic resistance protein